MSILDSIRGGVRSLIYGPDPDLSRRDSAGALILGGPRQSAVWPNYDIDGQMARAYRLAVVMACIDAIARDVSAAPLRVYRETDDGPQEEARHPARVVIREPNPGMSESEFWFFVVSMAAATGFCVIEKVRSGAGRAVELWPLVSPWIKVKPKSQAMPDWEYRVPGNDPWLLSAEDVIVVTYRPDMYAGFTGRSPLSTLRRELAIDDQITDFLNVLLERGGVPPLGLKARPQGEGKTVPKFSQAEADMYTEQFAQKYGGTRNWGKPVFLGGFEVEKIGLDLGQMLFPEVREYIELHTCSAFGVPAGMIGTAAGLARNTYSNAESDLRKYYDGTVAPLWDRLDGAFTRGLLREFDPGRTLEMDFDTSDIAALQEDEAPKWDQATRGLGAGLMMLDEARAHVGLPALPGGSGAIFTLPFSVTLVKQSDLLQEATPQPVPAALVPGNENPPQEPPDATESEADDDERQLTFAVRQSPTGPRYSVEGEHRDRLHTRSKKTISRLSKKAEPLLRAFWRAQGERIIAAAKRSGYNGADADGFMVFRDDGRPLHTVLGASLQQPSDQRDLTEIDWNYEEDELGKVLRRLYLLSGETAFAEVSGQLGVEIAFDLANPNVRRVMDRLGQRIVGINETTREDVGRVVTEAMDEGVSIAELSDRLTGLFEETYRGRATIVARSESQVAYNSANVLGYEETGQVAEVEMLDNPLHGDYDGDGDGLTCAMRNGLVVPLGQALTHIEGTHPACILAVAPVLAVPLGE